MSISLIACINKNRGLGYQNKLLYQLPEDMKFFRETTKNSVVIMGKNTFLSIGRPLPNRTNIIITRDKNFTADECTICHSVDDAFLVGATTGRPLFVIGGAQIYEQTIQQADTLYLTIVDDDQKPADTFFPPYDEFKNQTLISEGVSQGYPYQILKFTK
jgi:dihydrofolate reductase